VSGTLFNAGRPAAAAQSLDELAAVLGPSRTGLVNRWRIHFALYWEGPADVAGRAADALERSVAADHVDDPEARGIQAMEMCALEQWRIAGGRGRGATVQRLHAAARELGGYDARYARVCAALLDALLVESAGRDVVAAADRLQAEYDEHLPYFSFDPLFAAVPLVMARLRESHGDISGARAWVRRRPGAGSTQHVLLSTYLREEGRLAARAGDRDAAVRAWMHYLSLRAEPEAAAAAEVERVRQALAALTADAR
jgi:hypothetical protein